MERNDERGEDDAAVPPHVATVSTAADLRAAIEAGAQHIVLRSHIDLTSLDAMTDASGGTATLAPLPATVQSITVRCPALPELTSTQKVATLLCDIPRCNKYPAPPCHTCSLCPYSSMVRREKRWVPRVDMPVQCCKRAFRRCN